MNRLTLAIAAGLLLLPGALLADETWESAIGGTIVWHDDVNDTSIFLFDRVVVEPRAQLYIPGLPSSMDARGTYFGYWIDPEGGVCDAQLMGPDGVQSDAWGAAIVTFDRSTFPSGWTAFMGDCLDPPHYGMRADVP